MRIDREMSAIREAATEWVVNLGSEHVTAQERSDFAAWLRRSPSHVKEYLEAEAAWQAMEGAAGADEVAVSEILEISQPGVTEFPGGRQASGGYSPRSRAARPVRWAVAAAFVMAAVVLGPWIVDRLASDIHVTGIGETRKFALADGSEIELNTRSKVRIRMTGAGREVTIERGEAYFRVARDPARPFSVHSDTALIQVLGTEFNIYRQPLQTVVTVLQGRVTVSGSTQKRSHEIKAGQGAIVQGDGEDIRLTTPDARRMTAWRDRRLVFENDTLAAAVGEFNRYNTRQLIIASPQLATQRISGVFKVDRPDALVDFLTQTSGVRATDLSRSRTLLGVKP